MAKKTAKRAPVKNAAKKAPAKKATKKAAGGRAKTNNRREATLNFQGTKNARNATKNQLAAQQAAVRRGRRNVNSQIAVAGVTKTRGGTATLAKRQSRRNLDVPGTRFYDRDGNRATAANAFTKNGALRSGFQAERSLGGGRRGTVVGGGQNG